MAVVHRLLRRRQVRMRMQRHVGGVPVAGGAARLRVTTRVRRRLFRKHRRLRLLHSRQILALVTMLRIRIKTRVLPGAVGSGQRSARGESVQVLARQGGLVLALLTRAMMVPLIRLMAVRVATVVAARRRAENPPLRSRAVGSRVARSPPIRLAATSRVPPSRPKRSPVAVIRVVARRAATRRAESLAVPSPVGPSPVGPRLVGLKAASRMPGSPARARVEVRLPVAAVVAGRGRTRTVGKQSRPKVGSMQPTRR